MSVASHLACAGREPLHHSATGHSFPLPFCECSWEDSKANSFIEFDLLDRDTKEVCSFGAAVLR